MFPRPRSAVVLDSRRTRGINSYRCRVCHGVHPLRKCRRFSRLGVKKRLRAVLANRYCANCLAHEHSDGACRRDDLCKVCYQDHHTLLHMHERPASRGQSHQPASPSSLRSPTAPRPTVTARESAPSVPRDATGASQSAADPAMAPSLSSLLQRHSVNVLPTGAVVASKVNANLRLNLLFKIELHVRVRTPIRALSETVRAHFRDITLADVRFYLPATISVVFGADVYPKVMQPGFLKAQEGVPVAQSTVFGWVLSGACHQS
ncbi:hypothetical protein KR032_000633 [Drosophila birchii]|nr:hypothetical protein KR032_000633 [Drosophila birchii]